MPTNNINTYYSILGVNSDSTVEEIKHAFRQKAKALHPDRNKSPDAHEQFILVTEAYECLTNIKTGKTTIHQPTTSYTDWQRESRARARQQAQEYAQMEYEEFKKTDYYKNSQAAITVAKHLHLLFAILLLLSPLWAYLLLGSNGFWGGLLATFLLIPWWASALRHKTSINLPLFLQSLIVVFKTTTFQYAAVTLCNIIAFFTYTLNTQVTTVSLACILLVLYALTYLVFRFRSIAIKGFSNIALFLCISPTVLNLFFLINFVFSSNPTTEVYSFVHQRRSHVNYNEKTSCIILENNKYQNQYWFRVFTDFKSMEFKKEITYTFQEGLLGFRVLKAYEFTN